MISEHTTDDTFPTEVLNKLVEVLRELRNAVDPIEPIRPLSIAEAARALRSRRSEVERLIENGALPYINRNGRRYILPSDVSQWLRNESERQSPRKRRRTVNSRIEMDDVDPALREFFS